MKTNKQALLKLLKIALQIATYIVWTIIGLFILSRAFGFFDFVFGQDVNIYAKLTSLELNEATQLFFQSAVLLLFLAGYHQHATIPQLWVLKKLGCKDSEKIHLNGSKNVQLALFSIAIVLYFGLAVNAIDLVRKASLVNACGLTFLSLVLLLESLYISKVLRHRVVTILNQQR